MRASIGRAVGAGWVVWALTAAFVVSAESFGADPRVRTFSFRYAVEVDGLEPGKEAKVWVPVPQDCIGQRVTVKERQLPVERPQETVDKQYGNKILFFQVPADREGKIRFHLTYDIRRTELRGAIDTAMMEDLQRYLKNDRLAPAGGKHLKLIEDRKLPEDPMEIGRELYGLVHGMMKYSKEGTLWGRGDVDWVCDNKYGNCTDFHSLYIALLRSQKIPAKFEIGFGLPEKRGSGEIAGYHCWAKFNPNGKGWFGVDISEASKNPKMKDYFFGNLTEDRVAFSVGRDIVLEPKQSGPPLNFFVYPYVEVEGRAIENEKIKRSLSFEDQK